MKVKDIMTHWVKTVSPDTQLFEVVPFMCIHRLAGLPVVEGDNRLVGFIAEKDVLHHLFPRLEDLMEGIASIDFEAMESDYRNILQLRVDDLMAKRVISVVPDMPVLKAVSIMVKHHFRRIPVAVDGKLVGVLSMGDVHKALFTQNFSVGLMPEQK